MDDLISRQAAIKALWLSLYEYEDKCEKQFLESKELDVAEWFQHRIFVQNMSDIDRETIFDLPTIYAVPVVRCKDCKHRQELGLCPMYHLNYERYEWQLDDDCDDYTKDDGFCDRGEREDDE